MNGDKYKEFNEEDASAFYEWLGHHSNEWTEIRAIDPNTNQVETVFVNSKEAFIKKCREWSKTRHVYAGVNPRKKPSGKAEDVARVTVIPFDVDPPKTRRNQSATENEKKVAYDRLQDILRYVQKHGFGEPYLDDSGNGYRLSFKVNLPITNHEETTAKHREFFNEFKTEFPYLDNISDLPRIVKVPGTWSLKGEDTPDRPHRISKLIQLGDLTPNKKLENYILGIPTDSVTEVDKSTKVDSEVKLSEKKIQKLRPCFQKMIREGGRFTPKGDRPSESRIRQQFVKEMTSAGFNKNEILTACVKFDDYEKEKTEYEISRVYSEIMREGLTHWTCKSIHKHGGCLGPKCRLYAKKIEGTTGTKIGNYRLKRKGNKAFLVNETDEKVTSCNLDSVDGPRFKKRLKDITGLEEVEVDRATASFSFALQSIKKRREEDGEPENPEEKLKFSEDVEADIETELAKIVNAENQLEALKPHLDSLIVKEEDNKKSFCVLLAGSKYSDVEKKQIIVFKGMEGGGKTVLARELCRSYRVKEVGRFSAHALDYSNLENYDVLFLKELGAMDMEKQGVSTLKFLSSDDRGYVVEITVRDEETGKFTTEQHRIPCMTVVSTTTRLILESQFERRAWLFSVDESEEQTKEVLKWKAKRKKQKAEKLLGLRKYTDYEFSSEVLRRFIEQLEPKKIIIPFPETVSKVLGSKVLRVRGDIDKLYTFIELYGLFNLKRLQKLNENVYALTPEICVEAFKIIMKPLANMLSKMDERTRAIFEALKKIRDVEERLVGDEKVEVEIKYSERHSEITKKIRDRIAVEIGKSERIVRRFLNFLANSGFVSSDQKKPKTYTLLYNVETIEQKLSGVLDKFETSNLLIGEMRKEAQKWLKIGLVNKVLGDTINKNEKEGVREKKNLNLIMPYQKKRLTNTDLGINKASLPEKPSESWTNQKCPIVQKEKTKEPWIKKRKGTKIITKTGEVMFVCPRCKQHGKQLFFANEEDLKLHIVRLHTGRPLFEE